MNSKDLKSLNLEYLIAFGLKGQGNFHLGNMDRLEYTGIITSQFYGPDASSNLLASLGSPPEAQLISQGRVHCFLFTVGDDWLIGAFGHRDDPIEVFVELTELSKKMQNFDFSSFQ